MHAHTYAHVHTHTMNKVMERKSPETALVDSIKNNTNLPQKQAHKKVTSLTHTPPVFGAVDEFRALAMLDKDSTSYPQPS